MGFTNGTYKLLYIKSGTEYYPIGCLTSNSFSESVEMLGTTTRANVNGWKSSIPTLQEASISFDGVMLIDKLSTSITYRELISLKRGRTKIEWKIENALGDDVDYGFGYITTLSDSAEIDDYLTFSGAIDVVGEPLELIGNEYIDSDYYEDYYI